MENWLVENIIVILWHTHEKLLNVNYLGFSEKLKETVGWTLGCLFVRLSKLMDFLKKN
jgi:hypothetical protein